VLDYLTAPPAASSEVADTVNNQNSQWRLLTIALVREYQLLRFTQLAAVVLVPQAAYAWIEMEPGISRVVPAHGFHLVAGGTTTAF
jgi:hypothetical protein